MLTVTLSVLQLREVLHPDVLAKSIRPQEPHIDLLSSLMQESGLMHVKRICISLGEG
jgi:E3 ubiquitin-protein ligase MARCH6